MAQKYISDVRIGAVSMVSAHRPQMKAIVFANWATRVMIAAHVLSFIQQLLALDFLS